MSSYSYTVASSSSSATYASSSSRFEIGAFTHRARNDCRVQIYGSGVSSLFMQRLYPELCTSSKSSTITVNSTEGWKPISVGAYKKIRKVGSGTYGAVYLAKSPNGRTVALKHLMFENEKEGFPITAIREIKLLQSLKPPNIVKLFDIVTEYDNQEHMQIHMVFEYLEHDMSCLIHNPNVHLSMSHIKHFMYQLFSALDYCHNVVHILHRDIKTANLLVDDYGNVKIADFGLARQFIPELKLKYNVDDLNSQAHSHAHHYTHCNNSNNNNDNNSSSNNSNNHHIIVGHTHQSCPHLQRRYTNTVVTLWYRAPELLLTDNHYSPAIDMWSIGCVLAELLLKRPLFKGKSELQQFQQIIDVLGYPCAKNWPSFMQLTDKYKLIAKTQKLKYHHHQQQTTGTSPTNKNSSSNTKKLRETFALYNSTNMANGRFFDQDGYALMSALLEYNPLKRMSVSKALQSQWFTNSPLPVPPDFSNLIASHDYEARQHKRYGFKKSAPPLPVPSMPMQQQQQQQQPATTDTETSSNT